MAEDSFPPEYRALWESKKQLLDQLAIDPSLRLDGIPIQPFTEHYRTNNFIQNTLGRMFARYEAGDRWRWLTVDANNRLLVSTVQGSYNNNDTKTGNAPDAYGANIAFDSVASRLDIYIFDNPAIFKRSKTGAAFDDEFEIPAGIILHLDATCHSINIKNKGAGNVARYSIVGWW